MSRHTAHHSHLLGEGTSQPPAVLSSRHGSRKHKYRHARRSHGRFVFPPAHHLLITTPAAIYSFSTTGLATVFTSSKRGILAAKEAKDGTQVIAIADRHTVILHDSKRGREESWGLEGSQSQIRLLEYAPDALNLFLSTSLTGAIQCYSVLGGHAEEVGKEHPSPPTVLAVSPDGAVMISASEGPTVVYVQNLKQRGSLATQLHPATAVVVASFHPDRPTIFLMGFKDGSLAAYDLGDPGSVVLSSVDVVGALQDLDGAVREIGKVTRLHRITTQTMVDRRDTQHPVSLGKPDRPSMMAQFSAKSASVTGAAFLPGHLSRVVSVGSDGKCNIIDFETGGTVIRTWDTGSNITGASIPVAATSVSVLHMKYDAWTASRSVNEMQGHPLKLKIGARSDVIWINKEELEGQRKDIIAIGRVDGVVLLYDSYGLELDSIQAGTGLDNVSSVEWVMEQSCTGLLSLPSKRSLPEAEGRYTASVMASKSRAPRSSSDHPAEADLEDITLSMPSALRSTHLHPDATYVPGSFKHTMSGAIHGSGYSTIRRLPNIAKVPQQVRFADDQSDHEDAPFPTVERETSASKYLPQPVPVRGALRTRRSRRTFDSSLDTKSKTAAVFTALPTRQPTPTGVGEAELIPRSRNTPELLQGRQSRVHVSVSNGLSGSQKLVKGLGQEQSYDGDKSRKNSGISAKFAPYMNRTATYGLPRTGHRQSTRPDSGRTTSEEPPTTNRPGLRTKVSGPMSMTVGTDGVNSASPCPTPEDTQIIRLGLPEALGTSSPEGMGLDVQVITTCSDSDDMSPAMRRSEVRERLKIAIRNPRSATDSSLKDLARQEDATLGSPPLAIVPTFPICECSNSITDQTTWPIPNAHVGSQNMPTLQHVLDQACVSSTPNKVSHIATSHLDIDGCLHPASDDIRAICPRYSSLSPRHRYVRERQEIVQRNGHSPYAAINHAALNNRASKHWSVRQAMLTLPNANIHLTRQTRSETLHTGSACRGRKATGEATGSGARPRMIKGYVQPQSATPHRLGNSVDRRHLKATKAALALLGESYAHPLRKMSPRETCHFSSADSQFFSDIATDTVGETLVVHPGTRSNDRKWVEHIPAPMKPIHIHSSERVDEAAQEGVLRGGVEERHKTSKTAGRCKNCRVLLKSKRDLQAEVQALRAETGRLRSLASRPGQ